MPWKFEDDSPIYLQIVEYIKMKIASGELNGGDKLPAVRELALQAGVNPNTMQKALAELERQGFLYTQRTAGRFVNEDISQKKLREKKAESFMKEFTENMLTIGFEKNELIQTYENYIKEEWL